MVELFQLIQSALLSRKQMKYNNGLLPTRRLLLECPQKTYIMSMKLDLTCMIYRWVQQTGGVETLQPVEVYTFDCICAGGLEVPPMIVLPARSDVFLRNLKSEAQRGHSDFDKWEFTSQESGYSDSVVFRRWIEYFDVSTRKGKDPHPRVLLLDGLRARSCDEVLKYAQENKITLIAFPPNLSHLMQPLDVCFFGPLKNKFRTLMSHFTTSTGLKPNDLLVWHDLIREAHAELGDANIGVKAFEKCGLFPYNPDAILSQVQKNVQSQINDYEMQEKVAKEDDYRPDDESYSTDTLHVQEMLDSDDDPMPPQETPILPQEAPNDSDDDLYYEPPFSMEEIEMDINGSPKKWRFDQDMKLANRLNTWGNKIRKNQLHKIRQCESLKNAQTKELFEQIELSAHLLHGLSELSDSTLVNELIRSNEKMLDSANIWRATDLELTALCYKSWVTSEQYAQQSSKIMENQYHYGCYQREAREREILQSKQREEDEERSI